jgi:hypothetical protein
MDFKYEDTYAPYERIAAESGNTRLADLTDTTSHVSSDSGPQPFAGVIAGFLGAAVALGVANLTAAFVRPQASPITAIGGALEHFAVEKFGANDKNMLIFGVYFTVALLAMAIGLVAWQRVWVGVLGMGLFGLAGAFITVTRPGSHATDALPAIVGGIAAIAAIVGLIRVGTQRIGYESPAYESPAYESAARESHGYEAPAYETPAYQTAYETPAYETVSFGTPGYEPAGYETPSFETPSFGAPGYEPASYEPASYETPSFGAPGYETASYETPAYEPAGYGTPGYEFSASETPAYESATYRTTGWTS